MKKTLKLLESNPIIAATRNRDEVHAALGSSVNVIFLMGCTLLEIKEITKEVHRQKKEIFVHLELVKGLGKDKEAVNYLAHEVQPEGIVTTKPQLLKAAENYPMSTILQIFMIDSQAFDSGIKNIQQFKPDAVEIMPGLMPRVAAQIKSYVDIPLFTAGLIKQHHEVEMMLNAGCQGVTVSEQSLWGAER